MTSDRVSTSTDESQAHHKWNAMRIFEQTMNVVRISQSLSYKENYIFLPKFATFLHPNILQQLVVISLDDTKDSSISYYSACTTLSLPLMKMCFRSQKLKASSDTRNNRDIMKRYHDGSPMTAFVTS